MYCTSTGHRPSVFKTRIADLDKSIQDFETSLQQDSQHETKYKLVSEHTLSNLVGGLLCPHCSSKSLVFITSNTNDQCGFVSNMGVECTNCSYTSESSRSEKLEDSAAFDLNAPMVKFFNSIGQGFRAMEQFCIMMNMDGLSNNSFDKHVSAISKFAKESGNLNLEKARERVRQVYRELDNDSRPATTSNDTTGPIDLAVSFDGTWHKRGFTSNYGVGVVIELHTGLVIDYCVLSKYSHTCAITKRELGEDSQEFSFWFEGHKPDCSINYKGSSPAMEVHAAELLWWKSLEYNFRYTTLLRC